MDSKSMGALMPVLLVTVLVAGTLGGAMALWWESLTVDVTVHTGELNAALSVEGAWDNETAIAADMGEPNPEVKNVSYINCELSDDGNSITVTIENAYPGITYYCAINLENTGSIPFKIYSVDFEGNITDVMTSDSGLANGTIVNGTQVHPGEIIYDTLKITLTNDAVENHDYTGTLTIVVEQWNEYPTAPPS